LIFILIHAKIAKGSIYIGEEDVKGRDAHLSQLDLYHEILKPNQGVRKFVYEAIEEALKKSKKIEISE